MGPFPKTARVLAALGVLVAALALSLQFALLVNTQRQAGHGVVHALLLYLGFFTVLTNALCGLVFAAYLPRQTRSTQLRSLQSSWLTTSAAVAIAVVGVVYFAVLRRLWHPTGLQFWVDAALHYGTPLLFLAFWVAGVPRCSVRWTDLSRILLYPLLYLVYVFARGAATGLYPYFFIEIPAIGIAATARNTLLVIAAFLVVACSLILLNRFGATRFRRL